MKPGHDVANQVGIGRRIQAVWVIGVEGVTQGIGVGICVKGCKMAGNVAQSHKAVSQF